MLPSPSASSSTGAAGLGTGVQLAALVLGIQPQKHAERCL